MLKQLCKFMGNIIAVLYCMALGVFMGVVIKMPLISWEPSNALSNSIGAAIGALLAIMGAEYVRTGKERAEKRVLRDETISLIDSYQACCEYASSLLDQTDPSQGLPPGMPDIPQANIDFVRSIELLRPIQQRINIQALIACGKTSTELMKMGICNIPVSASTSFKCQIYKNETNTAVGTLKQLRALIQQL